MQSRRTLWSIFWSRLRAKPRRVDERAALALICGATDEPGGVTRLFGLADSERGVSFAAMNTGRDLLTLARKVDDARAAEAEARLAPKLGAGSRALGVGALLWTAYPALASQVETAEHGLRALASAGWRAPRRRRGLLRKFTTTAGAVSDPLFLTRVRRLARAERLRIALREVLPESMGGADVDVTAREISVLAEVLIELGLMAAMREVEARTGAPITEDGRRGRFVVLGMGKLGGSELNTGSDVDLIYLYDTDEGEAVGADGSTRSLHEVWTRVARSLTAILDEVTEEGALWRVDLRLRPEGSSGAIVNSLAAAERYYESFGRLWERAALLRARPVAGDLELGEQALEAVGSFIWRRRVDPTIASSMNALVGRSRTELSSDPARDLKLGPGGIREAEFFVQTLQLVWGGVEPRVRLKNTIDALRRLRSRGLVTDREGREISDAYFALRRAEHAIQTSTGQQTHSLPTARDDLERLARAVQFPDAATWLADLDRHRRNVAARFASLLPAEEAPSRWLAAFDALDRGDEQGFTAAVVAQRGESPVASDLGRNLYALARHADSLLGARSRSLYPMLADDVLDAVIDAPDPEQAAVYLRVLFARLRRPGVYVNLLGADPSGVRRLVETLGASAFIGGAVASNPELGDLVLFSRPVPTPALARAEVATSILNIGADEDPDEAVVGALRRSKARIVVEVGLADLAGELTTRQATEVLSALADAELEAAIHAALHVEEGAPVVGLAVIALGKLGGREIGYGSDLDVLFVYDPASSPRGADPVAYYTRAARRVIQFISSSHPAGPAYELDTRLRPSGNQGLLVTSVEAFARYHDCEPRASSASPKAASWEKMALLRARFVAGDPSLGAEAIRIAHAAAYAPVADPASLAAEIHRLRQRMERELSQERRDRYDLKLGRGGLVDIEFIVQYLSMVHAAEFTTYTTDTERALELLLAMGAISDERAETLREGYAFLRKLEQRMRIVYANSNHLIEANAPGLTALARRMGIRDRRSLETGEELLARYREQTERVRGVYEAIIVASAGEAEPSG